MPHVRRNVWTLPSDDKTLEWYGKAVGALKQRPITDPTSWWSLGAIHGIDLDIWQGFGFISDSTPLPPDSMQNTLWRQCQHMTWYFLPWHRGFVSAFEQIVRDAVKQLGGPDDWTIPYWDYSDTDQARELPRAFAKPTLPDGSPNFLHVPQRYGAAQFPNVQNPIKLDRRIVAITATMREQEFEGTSDGGSAGFGGVKTPFSHGDSDGTFGVLETQPHGGVHVMVGGGFRGNGLSQNPLELGLMTNPDTAALDPIFWLHHANIDRLWNVWLRQTVPPGSPPDTFKNPTDTDWLEGPSDRKFVMPGIDGALHKYNAQDMLDTKAPSLDYVYDDDAVAPPPVTTLTARLESLGVAPARASELAGAVKMTPPKPAELLGANAGTVRIDGDVVESPVRLEEGQRQRLSASLQANNLAASAKQPDHVYLRLENIKSTTDAGMYYVYVNLPQGADPEQHPDHLAGTVSMFGVSKASKPQGPTGGNGASASFDITPIVDRLHTQSALGNELKVKLVSAVPGTSSDVSIGRISVYRQGH